MSWETLYQWGNTAIAVLGIACIPGPAGSKPDAEHAARGEASGDALREPVGERKQQNDRLRFENQ